MRREVVVEDLVEDLVEDWPGCWEGWEEVEGAREALRGRRLEGRGGEKGERRNEETRLDRRTWIALALEFFCATVIYALEPWYRA